VRAGPIAQILITKPPIRPKLNAIRPHNNFTAEYQKRVAATPKGSASAGGRLYEFADHIVEDTFDQISSAGLSFQSYGLGGLGSFLARSLSGERRCLGIHPWPRGGPL
jgi:hypothetical protein